MNELDFSIKYPFSSIAKKTLVESKLQLTDRIVEAGLNRIKNALKEKVTLSGANKEIDKKEELASFAAARMILGYMRNSFLTNKFAVEEAGRIKKYLDSADKEEIDLVGKEFGLYYEKYEEKEKIKLPIYLMYSPRSRDYRLINRRIISGWVVLSKRERIRLIEEAARKRIAKIPIVKGPAQNIVNAAKELMKELPKRTLPTINAKPGDHPPCIEKLLEGVKKHENLNHQARWYLVVYLISIGMNDDQIIGIYSNLPDYNEKITKYQVEHARKRAYTVPSCSSVTTYGFCIANCRIGNPINWHDREKRGKANARKK